MNITVIMNAVVVVSISAIFVLLWLLIIPDNPAEVVNEKNKEKQSKVGNNIDFEKAVNVIIESSITSLEDRYMLDMRVKELTQKKLPLKIRILNSVKNTINDPFASLNYVQIGIAIVLSVIACIASYILFFNPVLSFVFMFLFIVAPFIFTNGKSKFIQVDIRNDNVVFCNTFYLNFLKNSDFDQAMQQTKNAMSPNSRGYKLADSYLKTKSSLSMLLPDAINELKLAMHAGLDEDVFFSICIKAVEEDTRYKKSLHPIIADMQDSVYGDSMHLKGCLIGISLYVIGICVAIYCIINYRYTNKELYEMMLSPLGQLAILVLFILFTLILPVLTKELSPIELAPYKVIKKYKRKEVSIDDN